jgi:phosphoglycerate dehydrogenase-like enzyme
MKKGVVIVNTARGAVMDEDALVKALDSGHVFSCGLDVYEDEPAVHPGLVAHPNVMLVPHMGTWTVEVSTPSSDAGDADGAQTQTKMEEWTIKNVRTVLEKGKLFSIVPEQAHLQQSNGVVKT